LRQPFELAAWPFGQDGAELAARLIQHAQDWQAAGRPSPSDLTITAYPAAAQETTTTGTTEIFETPGAADRSGTGGTVEVGETSGVTEVAGIGMSATAEPSGPRHAVIDKQYIRLTLSWRNGTGTAEETSTCE
jgi:hypothetical protein